MLKTDLLPIVGISANEPRANAPVARDGTADIPFNPVIIPASGAQVGRAMKRNGRTIADTIPRSRWITAARDKAHHNPHHPNTHIGRAYCRDRCEQYVSNGAV